MWAPQAYIIWNRIIDRSYHHQGVLNHWYHHSTNHSDNNAVKESEFVQWQLESHVHQTNDVAYIIIDQQTKREEYHLINQMLNVCDNKQPKQK